MQLYPDLNLSFDSVIPEKPLFTIEFTDPDFDIKGWLSIHSYGANGACGGTRLYPDVNREEVEQLAKMMTYKYCFFERNTGGAKAGICIPFDFSKKDRSQILLNYGRSMSPIIREYIFQPWTDMNSTFEDLKDIYAGAGITLNGPIEDTSYYTALSLFSGILATSEFLGIPPSKCNLTIEGIGTVGMYLAREILQWGGKLIGCSTRHGAVVNLKGLDIKAILKAREKHGDEWAKIKGEWEEISKEDLFDLPMDIHVPCARLHALTKPIAEKLQAKAVIPGANAPCTPDGEKTLNERGILLLPCFAMSGGSICGSSLFGIGNSVEVIRYLFLNNFKKMVIRLLRSAQMSNQSPLDIATHKANSYFPILSASPYHQPSFSKRLIKFLQQHHLFPNMNQAKIELTKSQYNFDNSFNG